MYMVGTWARRVGIAFLVIGLLLSLGLSNVVIGVDRTVLNGDHVADSLAEEDAYSVIINESQRQLEAQTDTGSTQEGQPVDELLPAVLTEAYVKEQTEKNIDRVYEYIHGERDDLYIAINTTPLKDDLAAELADRLLAGQDLAEIDPTLARMSESESQFEAERQEFKDEQLQRIQDETEQELSDAELEAIYDENRDQIREEAISQMENRVAASDQPEELKPAIIELGTLRIDAQLDPDMTYDEFSTQLEAERANLVDTVESLARDQLDEELPDTLELTEELSQANREQLDQLRDLVFVLTVLAFVLPLLSLGIALLIGWLSRTRSTGLFVVGSTVTVTGLLSVVGFRTIQRLVTSEIEAGAAQGDMSTELSGVVIGVFERTIAVFQTQSWLLVVLGVVIIIGGVVIRRNLVSISDKKGSDEPVLAEDSGSTQTGQGGDTDTEVDTDGGVDTGIDTKG